MDFEDAYVAAARMDPRSMTLAQKRCLVGACVTRNAFDALQAQPWSLTPYQAARAVHYAVSRRTKENAVDMFMAFVAYVESRPPSETLDPAYDRVKCICQRAGILDSKKLRVLLPLAAWLPDAALLLDMVAPRPPTQHAKRAFEAEMKLVRKVVWKRENASGV